MAVGTAGTAIRIKRLRVVRGKRVALQDLSVTIAGGTITGLFGPSGCGKTTLMRSIVGTQVIASGTVTVLGHPPGAPVLRRRVGYVTQGPTIYNDLRVIDNVRYFASLYGLRSDAADEAPRAQMPTWLEWISNAMPASYALESTAAGQHPP
ncbi:MAG: ATP-binding cassette domain-containing protein [Mycobacterium sp.]|nr:ATP-binding cassette domain-containing protein [Mycobacterium sp.]